MKNQNKSEASKRKIVVTSIVAAAVISVFMMGITIDHVSANDTLNEIREGIKTQCESPEMVNQDRSYNFVK